MIFSGFPIDDPNRNRTISTLDELDCECEGLVAGDLYVCKDLIPFVSLFLYYFFAIELIIGYEFSRVID